MTTTTSAYPLPVDAVTNRVREYATRAGAWPSLRQVMNDCRVGRPKAVAALAALRASGFEPTPDTATAPIPAVPPVSDAPDAAPPTTETAADGLTAQGVVFSPFSGGVDALDTTTTDADGSASVAASGPVSAAAPGPVPVPALGADRWGAWPLVVIALGAFVAIWGGWVGLGELTGFGPIRLLPGIADQVVVNSAITLPLGMEAYAAFALRAWLRPNPALSSIARRFARRSALGALTLGAGGQVAYHLMVAAGITVAPWPITAFVACLPVVVLGCGAALTHLIHHAVPTTGEEF